MCKNTNIYSTNRCSVELTLQLIILYVLLAIHIDIVHDTRRYDQEGHAWLLFVTSLIEFFPKLASHFQSIILL